MKKIFLFWIVMMIGIGNNIFILGQPTDCGTRALNVGVDQSQNVKNATWHYVKFPLPHQNMEVVKQSKEKFIASEQHDNATLEIHVVERNSSQNIAKKLLDELKNQGEVTIEFEQKVPWQTIDAYEIHGTYEVEGGVYSFWIIGTHSEQEGKTLCCSIKMLVGLDKDVWEQEIQSCLTSCLWVENEGDYEE